MESLLPSRTALSSQAVSALQLLTLQTGELEQSTSEALTRQGRHACLQPHSAIRRLLEELEFLHAHQARTLAQHAAALSEEYALPLPRTPGVRFDPPHLSTTIEPEEIVIGQYTQLNRLAGHYTRLHTLAIALAHYATADLALHHLKNVTPKIMECSQALPLLTAETAALRFPRTAPDSAQIALAATQAAWKNHTHFPENG